MGDALAGSERCDRDGGGDWRGPGALDAAAPLADPYAATGAARAGVSAMAVLSMVALLLGPIGAVAAMVLGWAARREIEEVPCRRAGRGLAIAGLTLGALFTTGWGAALAVGAWVWTYDRGAQADASEPAPAVDESAASRTESTPGPGGNVPQRTTERHVGALTVVDVGVDARTLAEELAKQRAAAYEIGEKVLVMTTRDLCEPCRGVDRSLSDPLTQTALRSVRLVRVDIDVFQEDLDELKIPRHRFPGFFLLAPDLGPQDGIDGGEWDDDIPRNIAPVLGAFVRGQYASRREPWKPLPRSGLRL